ncbi:MAG: metallophosphoesterase [Myxococcota bacterium]|nr:metallophosphoesterase [Myxococcota bacterium]
MGSLSAPAEPVCVEELYAVSDLHLGGPPGHQIFNQGNRLAALVDQLRSRPRHRQVALVLNGDIVDFLAEEGAAYLSPDRAVPMLERIFRDPAFAPVWQALGRFVKTPGRLLVLVLGNHDVELALPRVQQRLLGELCGEDATARARVRLAMDGGGFVARVGQAQVFCTHGNEVDPWNWVDHEALAQLQQAQAEGQPPPPWEPNAGTQLVVDVINEIKRRHPFVELLKPETKVVPQLLLALDPGSLPSLRSFGSILYRRARGTLRTGFLGGEEDSLQRAQQEEEYLRDLLVPHWREAPPVAGEDALLRQMEADFQAGLRPSQLVTGPAEQSLLGLGQYLWDQLTGQRSQAEALRLALRDWLAGDRSFSITEPDETYRRLDDRLPAEHDFVLAGHTHLVRALRRRRGGGVYYNSGTWIRLIRLTDELLGSAEAFAPVYAALTAGTLEALDRTPGLVLLRPTVVRILQEGQATVGEVVRVEVDRRGKVTLQPEPHSRFIRLRS